VVGTRSNTRYQFRPLTPLDGWFSDYQDLAIFAEVNLSDNRLGIMKRADRWPHIVDAFLCCVINVGQVRVPG
jgi:hypothetical protein